ncbi:MAG: hypothetical protein IPJ22_13125 [Bacteroidetes bacterium]|nr:hypothetical protein [Bacteroidota bacterium]MBK9355429.1 hypothetical protein [Bacteroidota bacterium]MBL0079848.1 hypothetical protein [Bacteroidota bacterium]MBL0287673.1 hypothetical protein [Bacteroidota bacterium]MBP9136281.1 hypothetical protein [Chitinophagales bacterium]
MHNIEPFYNWRHLYKAESDSKSPFYGRVYSEFEYSQKIYNFYIHPQWDFFGSETLYLKIICVDYQKEFAIIELIGEWNDAIENDIMFLKRDLIDLLIDEGIYKFVLIGENVLNFHSSDNCYYEEWFDQVNEEGGWIIGLNFRQHVLTEMENESINRFIQFGKQFNDLPWRQFKPNHLVEGLEDLLMKRLS